MQLMAVFLMLQGCGIKSANGPAEEELIHTTEVSAAATEETAASAEPAAEAVQSDSNPAAEATPEPTAAQATDYETIEVNTDNLLDYFEYFTEERWKQNSFGETNYLMLVQYLRIKPEYESRLSNNGTRIAVEYDAERNFVPIDVDYENKTYVLHYDQVHEMSISHTQDDDVMDYPYTELPEKIFGICTAYTVIEAPNKTAIWPNSGEPVLLRVEGQLKLSKE